MYSKQFSKTAQCKTISFAITDFSSPKQIINISITIFPHSANYFSKQCNLYYTVLRVNNSLSKFENSEHKCLSTNVYSVKHTAQPEIEKINRKFQLYDKYLIIYKRFVHIIESVANSPQDVWSRSTIFRNFSHIKFGDC